MEDEKSRAVLQFFNSIAPRYDRMNSLLSFGLHHLWKRRAIRVAGLQAGAVVLDVCGGTGDLALRAARAVGPQGRVLIYDMSMGMITSGRRKTASRESAARVLAVCGDAQAAALRAEAFDTVFIGFGLRNVSDRPACLREICRVLKPGGKLVCLEFSRPKSSWFRILYDLYSFSVIPFLGRLIAGSREAYTYLPESIRAFPLPEALASMMRASGFAEVAYTRLTDGVAVIHVGIKPFL